MPDNVWISSGRLGFSPFANPLEGVVKHHFARQVQKGRDWMYENSLPGKRQKLDDTGAYKSRPLTAPKTRMPYRRSSIRYRRRRARPRRASRVRALVRRVPRPVPMMWPAYKLVRFRVANRGSLSGASGVIDVSLVKANSLSDPMGLLGGELPLGLDQWAAMYSKYCVVSSVLRVNAHATAATGGIAVGCCLAKDNSTLTDVEHYRERPGSIIKYLTSDMDKTYFSAHYNGKRYEKIKDWKTAEDYHAAFSATPADPTTSRYYQIFIQDLHSGGGETATVDYMLSIDFTVLLFERIIPSRSTY